MISQGLQDNWKAFKPAPVERFTDQMECSKDWHRMGASGKPLRTAITCADSSGNVSRNLPTVQALPGKRRDRINAVKEICVIEEETVFSAAQASRIKADAPAKKVGKEKDSGPS